MNTPTLEAETKASSSTPERKEKALPFFCAKKRGRKPTAKKRAKTRQKKYTFRPEVAAQLEEKRKQRDLARKAKRADYILGKLDRWAALAESVLHGIPDPEGKRLKELERRRARYQEMKKDPEKYAAYLLKKKLERFEADDVIRIKRKIRWQEIRDEVNAKKRADRKANPEKHHARDREYYRRNRERIREKNRKYHQAHLEENRERCRKWRAKNRQKACKISRAYYRKHRAQLLEDKKIMYRIEENRERRAAYVRRWWQELKADPQRHAEYLAKQREWYKSRKENAAERKAQQLMEQVKKDEHARRMAEYRRTHAEQIREQRQRYLANLSPEKKAQKRERQREWYAARRGIRPDEIRPTFDRCERVEEPPEGWLTVADCAAKLGIPEQQILNAIARADLFPVKCCLPGKRRYRFVDPERVLALGSEPRELSPWARRKK